MSEDNKIERRPTNKRTTKIGVPRRAPSIVLPKRNPVYITADKTTCAKCTCYPKEDPYRKPKKLNPCQTSPLALYELAAGVVDKLNFPEAFHWSEEDVAEWMASVVGLPKYSVSNRVGAEAILAEAEPDEVQSFDYRGSAAEVYGGGGGLLIKYMDVFESMLDNHINGVRLLMFEDPSHLPPVNIRDFRHIQMISSKVREEFSTEFIKFSRSIGLPPRKPLTHTTWFKSRTGPSWGIRVNWTRCDILRWMKIIMPAPVYRDHWDLVWYQKPDFPKTMFARTPKAVSQVHIPHYMPRKEVCKEYLVSRKFRLQSGIPEDAQMIWMEHRPRSPEKKVRDQERKKEKRVKICSPKASRLEPKRVSLTGLSGNDLILARRKMPKRKFFT